jgi:hypothetical protein
MAQGIDNYLNQIAIKIYSNQNLCKLLYYIETDNPLNEPNLVDTSIIRTNKINRSLYFEPFTWQFPEIACAWLFVEVTNFKPDEGNIYFKNMSINFLVVVANSLWEINDGSNEIKMRPNMIIYELNSLFNNKRITGIGHNFIRRGDLIKFNELYSGYLYAISAHDFTLN